ncbi:hypothetical protein ACKWTF_014507 [Chironomus riparius]
MIPQLQFRRCIIFLCCISLTILTIFCYSFSNEFSTNLVQPNVQKQMQHLNFKKLQAIADSRQVEDQQNENPETSNIIKKSDVVSFFKNMVGKNFDFFVKLKDTRMKNVRFSKAGAKELDEVDQLSLAPNLIDPISKSSKLESIESNLLPDDDETSSTLPNLSYKDPNPIQNKPNLPYLGKVSGIYQPGFLYSPSKICESHDDNLQLIIMVTSAPGNFKARNAIRKTWGQLSSTETAKLVFIVGSSIPKNEKKLNDENAKHADLIHGNFVDSYFNLTLKTISMLEWVINNCRNAKFILKADDDTFINVNKLLKLLKPRMSDTKTIYGRVGTGWTPFRDKMSKYYISFDEFSDSVFPDLTSGPAYMMTRDCAELIYNEALNQKYLKLEDVFITGIIGSRLNIQRLHLQEFLNKKPSRIDECLLRKSVSVHYVSPREQLWLWKIFIDGNKKC